MNVTIILDIYRLVNLEIRIWAKHNSSNHKKLWFTVLRWKRSEMDLKAEIIKAEFLALDQACRLILRASLSGTFFQTLPELVTQLKGHSLSPRSCPPTRSAPSERFGYWYNCGSNLAPKHPRKQETHPPRVKSKIVPSRFKRFWLYLCWGKQRGHAVIKETSDIIWVVCY